MDAPSHIYASPDPDDGWRWPRASQFPEQGPRANVCYVRSDLAAPDLAELVEALRECTEWMESLRASGDAGFWDWEDDEYTRAITALAKIKEPT